VIDAGLDDRASEPASSVAVGDVDAPDARAVLLLLSRFPNDPRHRHETLRMVGIGDRKDSTNGIREACFHRGKLKEAAVIGG
jgi:hypothetical protein